MEPSANFNGDLYPPNLPANCSGGCAKGSSFFHSISGEAGCCAAKIIAAAGRTIATRQMPAIL
jgi:hypothetical protein